MPVKEARVVLVVDDDRFNTVIVSSALKKDGYKLITANSGHQAVEAVKEHVPDIILLDVIMPDMDGFAVCEAVRAMPEGKLIPIIMLTGLEDENAIEKAFALGADEYVLKPVNFTVLRKRVKRLLEAETTRRLAEYYASTDYLTGVCNRRAFIGQLEEEVAAARQTAEPLSLIMTDVDLFKNINDTYGHQAGDLILQTFTTVLTECCGEADCIGRYGGEEFVVLLPGRTADEAAALAEQMRLAVEKKKLMMANKPVCILLTASFGVAEYQPQDELDVDHLIYQADQALYQSKHNGRNCVSVYRPA